MLREKFGWFLITFGLVVLYVLTFGENLVLYHAFVMVVVLILMMEFLHNRATEQKRKNRFREQRADLKARGRKSWRR